MTNKNKRIILVTGASRGVGKGIAEGIAQPNDIIILFLFVIIISC
tara:strand:+ start:442 stop:576 length:135 start_codon:yes stop_codon:yes gene_type:complete